MEGRLLFVQLGQVVCSTFIMFFLMVLIAESLLWIFGIKNPRARAIVRLIPILKMPLEVLCVRENLFVDLNIFSCSSILKTWILPLFVAEEQLLANKLTLSQYIAYEIPVALTSLCIMSLLLFLGFMVCKIIRFFYAFHTLQKICDSADAYERVITNVVLKQKIKNKKVQILVSSLVVVPCAFHSKYIVFPEFVNELSQEEFEAVTAHELEHLRWFDPLIKFTSLFISSLFFWIPASLWLNKLEHEQEHASDLSIQHYGLSELSFANAIMKMMKQIQTNRQNIKLFIPACTLIRNSSSSFCRIQAILKNQPIEILNTIQYFGVAIILLSALIIGFKMC